MSIAGTPDWSRPLRAAGGDLYVAYEEPRRAFAPPRELRVSVAANGAPALSLELMRLNAPDGPKTLGLLTIRFVADYALSDVQQAVFSALPDVKVEPLIPRGGFLRFQAANAAEVPPSLLEPQPLIWSGAGSLTFATQLGESSTMFIRDALVRGLLVVTALAEVETWGVAGRVTGSVRFNPASVARVIQRFAPNGKCTLDDVAAMLARTDDASILSLTGADRDAPRRDAARATAERLIGRFAKLVPAADPSRGATYAFDQALMLEGEITWDLNEPLLVPKGITLASDPLATAQQALNDGVQLITDAPPIDFPTGLHMLTIHANLPPKRAGVMGLTAEIRVPPHPPARPQTVTGSAMFREADASKNIAIRLAPDEPLAFEYQTTAFVTENGAAKQLRGPLLHHNQPHLTIAPDSFPVRFVRVEATHALCELTTLRVACRGTRGGKPWSARTQLDRLTTAVAIAVPRDVSDGALDVTAMALDGSRTAVLPLPLDDCWIDLTSFPTAGPRLVAIVCEFDDSGSLAVIECAPEERLADPDAAGLVRLTPAMAAREWRWLVTNPLRDRYCWRWFRPAGPPDPWSAPIDPTAGALNLKSSARVQGVPAAAGATP